MPLPLIGECLHHSIYVYVAHSAKRDVRPVTPLGKGQCFSLHLESASGSSYGVYVCWLACEDKVTLSLDLHVGPQRTFDGSECDIVSGILLVNPVM